jgi:hypothetical protein
MDNKSVVTIILASLGVLALWAYFSGKGPAVYAALFGGSAAASPPSSAAQTATNNTQNLGGTLAGTISSLPSISGAPNLTSANPLTSYMLGTGSYPVYSPSITGGVAALSNTQQSGASIPYVGSVVTQGSTSTALSAALDPQQYEYTNAAGL